MKQTLLKQLFYSSLRPGTVFKIIIGFDELGWVGLAGEMEYLFSRESSVLLCVSQTPNGAFVNQLLAALCGKVIVLRLHLKMASSNNMLMNPLAIKGEWDQSFTGTEYKPTLSDMDTTATSENDNFEAQAARKPWLKRPGASIVKVAPDVKRRRKNHQAKKLMIPKNPLMILNELKPGLPYTTTEKSENNQILFVVTVEIDGQTFSGQASSKKLAQQEAAESALRGLYFDKLMEQLSKKEEEDVPMKEEDNQADGVVKAQIPEDDTPWSSLASLAMFKLAAMWQSSTKSSVPVTTSQIITPSTCVKGGKIPPNPYEVDPVMLLYQISPASKFTEQERDVRQGATVFTLTVDFNGQVFCGSATKKKAAKKICAKLALKTVGIEYPE